METVVPPLNAILEIQMSLRNGLSIRSSIEVYLGQFDDDFSRELRVWYVRREKGLESSSKNLTMYRKHFFELLNRGLKGEPILDALTVLQNEMIEVAKEDMEEQLQKLPVLMLIPLLFFQFPAFMLILLGPVLLSLSNSLELV